MILIVKIVIKDYSLIFSEIQDLKFNILDRPTLTIWKPHDGTRPTLNIDAFDASRREEKPTIRIHTWRPDHRIFSRPGLSIEHKPRNSWNDQTHGSTGRQVSSNSFSYGFSTGDPVS